MGTYSEWRNGPYSEEGIHCQNCYMPLSMTATAVTVGGDTTENFAHDHRFQGGHSQINLKHAANLDVYINIFGKSAQVEVFITNAESGHKLPTGMPGKKLVLNVRVLDQDGNVIAKPSRIYRKVLMDENNTILEGNTVQLLNAVRIYNDNRIAPKEKRKEEFLIDLGETITNITVEAELLYEYETPVMYTQKILTEMAFVEKNYSLQASPTEGSSGNKTLFMIVGAAIILTLITAIYFKYFSKG